MNLGIGIPILATTDKVREQTLKTISLLRQNQSDKKLTYIFFDNGSDPEVKDWIQNDFEFYLIRSEHNRGLPISLNFMLDRAKEMNLDYVFFTHTDVEIYEKDWDLKVEKCINQAGNVGIAGFFGAYGVGTSDIYKTPYIINQLSRIQPCAGNLCRLDPRLHGHSKFTEDWRKVACLDGFSQIIKVDSPIRLDESFGPHHAYDTDLGLQAYDYGYQVICINMDCIHIGGVTDVNENWNKDFAKEKAEIHAEAHIPFYEKWRAGNRNITLPFRI